MTTATETATRTSKKQYVYYAKQQLCTCSTLFCTFLYRPCTTTTLKCLIASFMEDANERRRISLISPLLSWVRSSRNPATRGKFAYICHFHQIGINATVFEKREFILKATFSLPLPSSMLKLPNTYSSWPKPNEKRMAVKKERVHMIWTEFWSVVISNPVISINGWVSPS